MNAVAARALAPSVGRMSWPVAQLARSAERVASLSAASSPADKPRVPSWCAEVYVATPPNIGAWRLAWWLKEARLHPDAFIESLGVRFIGVRMLNGEAAPYDALAERIARRTEGFVRPEHWARACAHGWLDDARAATWTLA